MHNCKETKEQLTELALNEAVLPAEASRCDECRAEFEALNATLRVTTRLRDAAAPLEDYWTGYHARLRHKLQHVDESRAKARRRKAELGSWSAPLRFCARTLVKFVRSSVPIPVPLGIAVIILFTVLAVIAIRKAPAQPQNPIVVQVPLEVPVVHEKTVTQVVYRDRRRTSQSLRRTGTTPSSESTLARSQKPRHEDLPVNLTGFKPTDEIKLTVIKGGVPNEK